MDERLNYLFIKKQLKDKLDAAEQYLQGIGFEQRVQAARSRLCRERMNLLVVGEFSRGKSTFINALLGQPVLPSRVNPTTATITVLEGQEERKMIIIYQDGQTKDVSLPAEKVNKYLDSIVTTLNNDVQQVKQVMITWPGRLEEWNCRIVDTPGVNDLDEVREEITYRYLSQADACIVILDSQQPLSESERRFLQDKVLANDVNRVLFVINRIDEVESEPYGETSRRLIVYVKQLLQSRIPAIKNPEIFALSSKEALRARFKNESTPWMESFISFEDNLIEFISANAARGRIPDHIVRVKSILRDGMFALNERKQLFFNDDTEVQKQLDKLYAEEERLEIQLRSLSTLVDMEISTLSRHIQHIAITIFTKRKEEFHELMAKCQAETEVDMIKSKISSGIRDAVLEISTSINNFKRETINKLKLHFSDLFSEELYEFRNADCPSLPLGHDIEKINNISYQEDNKPNYELIGMELVANYAMGFAWGLIAGPIGLIPAIFGGGFISKKLEEREHKKRMREAIDRMRNHLDEIINNAQQNSMDVARKEVEPLKQIFIDKVQSRIDTLKATIYNQRQILGTERNSYIQEINKIDDKMKSLDLILKDVEGIKGTLN
jgi:predicted GTPase